VFHLQQCLLFDHHSVQLAVEKYHQAKLVVPFGWSTRLVLRQMLEEQ
jgi:hypothetical protein